MSQDDAAIVPTVPPLSAGAVTLTVPVSTTVLMTSSLPPPTANTNQSITTHSGTSAYPITLEVVFSLLFVVFVVGMVFRWRNKRKRERDAASAHAGAPTTAQVVRDGHGHGPAPSKPIDHDTLGNLQPSSRSDPEAFTVGDDARHGASDWGGGIEEVPRGQ
ncbi:hypothetical protein C8F01DRAFT_281227 [Mycena amicta]|nr:hypothetical protein C8F01DRAFT_281227 [Mycena amicta]